jgi:hypothetical protein
VVGTEFYANPLLKVTRHTALDRMTAVLALSPQARARLGLTVSAARADNATVDGLLAAVPKRIRREQKGQLLIFNGRGLRALPMRKHQDQQHQVDYQKAEQS